MFDKRLTITQNGAERELTVDEALQLQTYQAALKGSKPAVRQVLKMIEKREKALQAKARKTEHKPSPVTISYDSDSANAAMLLLDSLCHNPDDVLRNGPRPLLVQPWAAQSAVSRPGRRRPDNARDRDLHLFVRDFPSVRMPGRSR